MARTIVLRKKSESVLMRLLGWVLRPVTPAFMSRFWTTIGHTIYTPTVYDADADWGQASWEARHQETLEHEGIHVAQVERWGLLVQALLVVGPAPLLLLLTIALAIWVPASAPWIVFGILTAASLPLSVGLAWGRWRVEREAYLPSIIAASRQGAKARDERIDFVVGSLWSNYAMAWPRAWMRSWFLRACR